MDMHAVLEIVTRSDPGMVRSNNEDSVMANPVSGFAVLADGMGGYNAGEVASGMATAMLGTELERAFNERAPSNRDQAGRYWAEVALETEMARVNGAIYQAAQSQPQYAGMGTTLVVAVFHDNKVTVEQVRQQLAEEYPLAAVPFDDYVEKSDVLEPAQAQQPVTVSPARIRRMESRSIHTASGIEVKIPTEILSEDSAVEFLHAEDGSVSLLIKNVIL